LLAAANRLITRYLSPTRLQGPSPFLSDRLAINLYDGCCRDLYGDSAGKVGLGVKEQWVASWPDGQGQLPAWAIAAGGGQV